MSGSGTFAVDTHALNTYSKVSNRWGVWISRGGWKKYQKLIVWGLREGGGLEYRGVGLAFKIAFFFPFVTMKTTVFRTFAYTVKVK